MPQVYGEDQPVISQAEHYTGLTTQESDYNINSNSSEYQGADTGHSKKASLFGKLKEKTKRAGDKIKLKVGKKKSDDTTTGEGDYEDDSDEEDETTNDLPSTGGMVTPPSATESTPRALGTFDSKLAAPASTGYSDESEAKIPGGFMKPKDFDSTPAEPETTSRDLEPIIPYTETELNEPASAPTSGAGNKVEDLQSAVPGNLSSAFDPESAAESRGYTPETETNDFNSEQTSDSVPAYGEKASHGANVAKDAAYGGLAAAAGAVGYDAAKDASGKDRTGQETSGKSWNDWASEKTQEAKDTVGSTLPIGSSPRSDTDVQGQVKDIGNRSYDTAANAGRDISDSATGTAYGTRDAVASKAEDLNNATNDSETYTQKAANTVYAAKDAAILKAGELNNNTGDSETYTQKATNTAYAAGNVVTAKAADWNNSTNDSETYIEKAANTAYAAKDNVVSTLGLDQSSEGPSILDKAKGYSGSAVDTTNDQAYSAKDTAGDYAGSAADTMNDNAGTANGTAKDYFGSATDTAQDNVTSAKDTVVGSTGSATETSNIYTGSAADATKGYAGAALDTTKDYAGRAADLVKGYTGAAVDTSKDVGGRAYDSTAQNTQAATDTSKGYAGSAIDTTKDYTQQATDIAKDYTTTAKDTTLDYATSAQDTVVDTATPKEHDKALSDHVTETISNLPAQVKDTVVGYTQSATTPAAHDGASQGVVERLTGLFGFGKKEVHDDVQTPAEPATVTASTTGQTLE